MRELASIITKDIFLENPDVHWTDIAGLDQVTIALDSIYHVHTEYCIYIYIYTLFDNGIIFPLKHRRRNNS